MDRSIEFVAIMILPAIAVLAGGALIGIAIWAGLRRRERELHYKHELLKRFVDKGADREEVASLMREQSNNAWASKREGIKIGGIVNLLAGLGTMYGLTFIEDEAIWRVGAIPALVGLGLLIYATWMAPRQP